MSRTASRARPVGRTASRGGRRRAGPDAGCGWARPVGAALWLLCLLLGTAATVSPWTVWTGPSWVAVGGAVVVTTALAVGLAVRTGGHPFLVGPLVLACSAAVAFTDVPVLRASAAVVTAALGALLGVFGTRPASHYLAAAAECLVATAVAVAAAFALPAYDATVDVQRAEYVVIGVSLAGALALVVRLAAGRAGLGTRGALVVVGGLVVLALLLAYGQALARWGSPELADRLHSIALRGHQGPHAVPRPLEYLLGYPALAWGVSTRGRRRQGWWGCAFGAVGLAVVATTLLHRRLSLEAAGLGLGYALLIGLVIGGVLVATDRLLSGSGGRRARRADETDGPVRREPGRFAALM